MPPRANHDTSALLPLMVPCHSNQQHKLNPAPNRTRTQPGTELEHQTEVEPEVEVEPEAETGEALTTTPEAACLI